MTSYLSVDIGGTKVAVARILVEERKARIDSYNELETKNFRSAEDLCNEIISILLNLGKGDEKGIGISSPGLIDYTKGIILDWTGFDHFLNYPFKDRISNKLNIPASIRNDAECFVMGEWAFGAGSKTRPETFVGVTLGSGMGSCLLINGKPYKGAHGYAGEIGEILVREKLLEPHASGDAFIELSGKSGKELFKLAIKGDQNSFLSEQENHWL